MKKYWKLLLVTLCMVFALSMVALAACGEKTPEKPEYGKITGVTVDANGEAIEEVTIYYGEDSFVESDEDGNFEIRNVKVGDITLTASLAGYADTEKTLTADNFNNEGVASTNIVMAEGKGTIKGVVSMDGYSLNKLEGATVRINGTSFSTTTNAAGEFEFKDVPMLGQKTVIASLDGYTDGRRTVTASTYKDGVASNINIALEQNDCAEIAGIKPYQLEAMTAIDSSKLTIKSSEISSYFSLSRDNLQGSSKVETHGEGFCINANTTEMRDNMVSFIFAKVNVDNNHKYLTAYARVFFGQNGGATREEELAGTNFGTLAELGLYAFDDEGKFINDEEFANFTKINTESFMPVTFDLTKYAGKTITIILGTKTGYHCCLDRLEFTNEKPSYLKVNGVEGLTDLRITGTTDKTSFDAEALKSDWTVGGGVGIVSEGIQLNGADPWKAVHFDDPSNANKAVNSYMFVRTDLTEANSYINITATIVNRDNCLDPGNANDKGPYFPYICVILIDKDGNKLFMSDWTQISVEEGGENTPTYLAYDLSEYADEDVTVVIAANVGYRATITDVQFSDHEIVHADAE